MDVSQADEPHCSTEVSLELKPVSSTYTYAEQQEYNQMCSASTSYENNYSSLETYQPLTTVSAEQNCPNDSYYEQQDTSFMEDANDPSANQNEDEVDDYYMFGVEHDDFDVELLSDEEVQHWELPASESTIDVKVEGVNEGVKEPREDNIASIYKVLNIKNTKNDIDPSDLILPKQRVNIPTAMQNLMGQANKEYMRGDHQQAIKICKRIIQEHPQCFKPYETLSEIYSEVARMGGSNSQTLEELTELSVECQYFAASLRLDNSARTWILIGDEFLNINKKHRATSCFKKAFKLDKENMELAKKLKKLICETVTSEAVKLESFEIIVTAMKDSEQACKLAYEQATKAFQEGKKRETNKAMKERYYEVAINLLKKVMRFHKRCFDEEKLHHLCELCVECNKWKDVLKALDFMEKIKLFYLAEDQTTELSEGEAKKVRRNDVENIRRIDVLPIPIDLKSKAVQAAIHCNLTHLVQDTIASIIKLDSAFVADVQISVCVACFEAGQYAESLRLIEELEVHHFAHFSTSKELFKLKGMSLLKLNDYQSAKENFFKCLQISAEDSVDIRLELAAILLDTGEYRVAIETLDGAENGEDENEISPKDQMRLLNRRFEVFKKWGQLPNKKKKLAAAADVVLIMFANRLKSTFKTELSIVQRTRKSTNPFAGEIKLTCKRLGKQRIDEELYLKADWQVFKQRQWIDFYKELLNLLNTCKRYKEAALISDQIMKEKHFFSRAKISRSKLEVILFRFSLLSGWYSYAFGILKKMILSKKEDQSAVQNHVWNIFNQVVTRLSHSYQVLMSTRKFLHRIMVVQEKKVYPLQSMFAHGDIASSNFRPALNYYIELLEEEPENPELHLIVGICYCHILTQKTCGNKHTYVAQAFALLAKYCQLRNNRQESLYNIGRAFHQIGLNHFAVHVYEDALECGPPTVVDAVCEDSFDLRHEIAFNLSLVYRQSGNHVMANYVLFKHNVV